ncbi:MAG: hypothetical protein H5T68_12145 [Chloroflexi bacterium]|nr:hypothetical protein [Chloroflexota bacterium]
MHGDIDWSEKRSSRSVDIALEPSRPTFPLPELVSASSIAYPEMIPVWQQPGLSLVHASELQFRLIEQRYILRRRAEVIGFIKAYLFLAPLLLEAYGKIAEYFGPRTDVVLEVVSDPEAANYRELFILVRTSLTPSEALTLLERFDQEWWLDASEKARCMLNIDVEYI